MSKPGSPERPKFTSAHGIDVYHYGDPGSYEAVLERAREVVELTGHGVFLDSCVEEDGSSESLYDCVLTGSTFECLLAMTPDPKPYLALDGGFLDGVDEIPILAEGLPFGEAIAVARRYLIEHGRPVTLAPAGQRLRGLESGGWNVLAPCSPDTPDIYRNMRTERDADSWMPRPTEAEIRAEFYGLGVEAFKDGKDSF